jgi:hypothetical protein
MNDTEEQHIWDWIKNHVERTHEFYDHRFPPCPYAQKARLAGAVTVHIICKHFQQQIYDLSFSLKDSPNISTRVMALPTLQRWNLWLLKNLRQWNTQLVDRDTYLQWGWAEGTRANTGWLPGRYFVIVANRLAAVMAGSESLKKTDYYNNWPQSHMDRVVGDRQRSWDQRSGNRETNKPI